MELMDVSLNKTVDHSVNYRTQGPKSSFLTKQIKISANLKREIMFQSASWKV